MTDEQQKWKSVTDRYMSDEAKADFDRALPAMGDTFDAEATGAKWKDLGARIKAAMPMDPASAAAQAFVAEWNALLEPFTRIATPAMMADTRQMYANMDKWEGQADPGFDHEVFLFIQAASAAAK